MPTKDSDDQVVALVLARSPETVERIGASFAEAGFTVGPASGPTFWIQAPASRFEETFGAAPQVAPDGGWTTGQGDEFPLSGLAEDLRHDLVAVALERPTELHGEER